MTTYIVSRLLTMIPVLLIISVLVFSILHLLPGDPVVLMMAGQAASTPERVEALREQLGLNDPLHIQYLRFIGRAVTGDLGRSVHFKRPVTEIIIERLPRTLELAASALVLGAVIGIVMGVLAATHHNSWVDSVSMVFSFLGITMPIFFIGLVLIFVFSVRWPIFPVVGGTRLTRLILPVVTLGIVSSGTTARLVRGELLEVLGADYIVTARAKGLREQVVLVRHAMRNSLIPVITILGLQVGSMLSGSVLTETVFNRAGIGRLAVEAIVWKDLPLAQGTILFTATFYLVTNLLVDLSYAWLDPRIRYERTRS